MPQFQQEYLSTYTVKQLHDLVMDVESYPQFLPWCYQTKIVQKSKGLTTADLTVKFKGILQEYRSEIKNSIKGNKLASIDVCSISGPFKHLINKWYLEKVGNHTQVKFFINFEFKSVLLDKLIGIFFSLACKKMVEAFNERARKLYGN